MGKRWIYFVFVFFLVLVLAWLAWYFLHLSSPVPSKNWQPVISVGSEPISPIPLELNLDANKVALGSRLFKDPKLSVDGSVSCSSCHQLNHGGVDNLPRSIGIYGAKGDINAPTIFNSAFNWRLFWDGRAASLEAQIDGPLQHPKEMGSRWVDVLSKLNEDANYRASFAALYPAGITRDTVKDALATFERSLTTPNAKFDRYLRGDKTALNENELAGYALFKKLGCIGCHQGVNVGGNMYEKLGLVDDYFAARGGVEEVDFGRYNHTKIEEHRYEFRVPSLRNVALTAPYFHDASVDTLERAVGVMAKYQLGLTLPPQDVASIVAFLNTLTGDQPTDVSAP